MPQLWSSSVHRDKPTVICPADSIRVTNAALGDITDPIGRTIVKLTYRPLNLEHTGRVATVLCTLVPRKMEQCILNIDLSPGHEYHLTLVGENDVFLTGSIGVNSCGHHCCMVSANKLGARSTTLEENGRESTPPAIFRMSTHKSPAPILYPVLDSVSPSISPLPSSNSGGFKGPARHSGRSGSTISSVEDLDLQVVIPSHFASTPKHKRRAASKHIENKDPSSSKSIPPGSDEPTFFERIVGTGQAPVRYNHKVLVRFVGRLDSADGSIFSKNVSADPFSFIVGSGDVVKGFSIGILGMREGGERRIFVPATLGYGKDGNSRLDVPPDTNLVIDCKLLEIV